MTSTAKRTAQRPASNPAIEIFESGQMRLLANASRYRLGQLIGGDEGSALIHAASAFMRQQNVKNIPRLISLLIPAKPR